MMLLTKANKRALPRLNEGDGTAHVKFFTPWSNWTWYATEFDGEDLFFGLVEGFEKEAGYFSLGELMSVRGPFGLRIERDRHFKPVKVIGKESKIKCPSCGISVPDVPEDATHDETLCNKCYEERERSGDDAKD